MNKSEKYGYNAFLQLIEHPMVNWCDYTTHEFNRDFVKGIEMAQNKAIKTVKNTK